MLGQVLAIIGIVEAIFALLGTGSLNYALAATAFPFILLWYLNGTRSRRRSGSSKRSRRPTQQADQGPKGGPWKSDRSTSLGPSTT